MYTPAPVGGGGESHQKPYQFEKGGGSTDFGQNFLCFNRDFEVSRKIGRLPPRRGEGVRGEFFGVEGGVGGSHVPV